MIRHVVRATIWDKKGNLLSTSENSYTKSHPKQALYAARVGQHKKIYLHAEIAALVKCKGVPYKIKIERYGRDGEPRNAAPCPICSLAIKESGIKIIEHTI